MKIGSSSPNMRPWKLEKVSRTETDIVLTSVGKNVTSELIFTPAECLELFRLLKENLEEIKRTLQITQRELRRDKENSRQRKRA